MVIARRLQGFSLKPLGYDHTQLFDRILIEKNLREIYHI